MKSDEELNILKDSLLQLSDEFLRLHNELDDKLHAAESDPNEFMRIFMYEVMPINVQLMFLMGRVNFIDFMLDEKSGGEEYSNMQRKMAEEIGDRYKSMVEKADYIFKQLNGQG